jgi:hypothetical protein
MADFDKYLNRRMITEHGMSYFCRICGTYKPETEFYTSKTGPFKIDTKCKEHYTRKEKDDSPEMEYLKLDTLKEIHFHQSQVLLQNLGYEFGPDKEPIHIQFNKKHNL